MSRRNRLIYISAVDALVIFILSTTLFVTEYWIWGVVFALFSGLWLGAFIQVNIFGRETE